MERQSLSNYRKPIILIISNNKTKLTLSCSILAFFNQFQITFDEQETLSWIHQHQPDLIILDLKESEQLPLVTTLKLDWLTRDIPMIAIIDSTARQLDPSANLNDDACLSKPYSVVELEQKICSLVLTCKCEFSDKAILKDRAASLGRLNFW